MSNNKLLDKLAKMVASRDGEAKIGNEAAAEAFATAINRLLLDHDLSMEEVQYRATVDTDPVIELDVDYKKYGGDAKKARVGWQEALAHMVADAHMCKLLVYRGSNVVRFVGTKSHATVAEYAHGTLSAAVEKLSWDAYNTYFYGLKGRGEDVRQCRGFRAAWLSAFIARLKVRFAEAKRNAVAAAEPGVGLMRISQSLAKAQAHIDGMKLRMSKGARMDRAYNREGARQGKEAADKIALDRRGVSGGQAPKLGA